MYILHLEVIIGTNVRVNPHTSQYGTGIIPCSHCFSERRDDEKYQLELLLLFSFAQSFVVVITTDDIVGIG